MLCARHHSHFFPQFLPLNWWQRLRKSARHKLRYWFSAHRTDTLDYPPELQVYAYANGRFFHVFVKNISLINSLQIIFGIGYAVVMNVTANQASALHGMPLTCFAPVSVTASATSPERHELIDLLPRTQIIECNRKDVIYSPDNPPSSLFMVISGRVKACRSTPCGRDSVMDIYIPDEVFGESAFLPYPERAIAAAAYTGRTMSADPAPVFCGTATALEFTRLMQWPISTIHSLCSQRLDLSFALLQFFARRSLEQQERLESFCADPVPRRLVRMLLRMADRMGIATLSGDVAIRSFTHDLISEYVGTSREIITHYMSHFRGLGLLEYNRKSISLDVPALRQWISNGGRG